MSWDVWDAIERSYDIDDPSLDAEYECTFEGECTRWKNNGCEGCEYCHECTR